MPRFSTKQKCAGCGLRPAICVCASLPRVALPWALCVVQHRRERVKPSNTGRLLERVVENCRLVTYASMGAPLTPEQWFDPARSFLLLFPAPNARALDAAQLREWSSQPTTLVLLDATWRQARRMSRRAPGIRELPCWKLPEGPPSTWRLRRAPRADQLCTFETVLRLAQLAGDPCRLDLEAAFALHAGAQRAGLGC